MLIADSAEALDAMNVFPVSDSDTGSNLELTLAGIADAVPDVHRGSLDALVQAAILSAHGNSGAIVAEMFASVARALEQDTPALRGTANPDRWSPGCCAPWPPRPPGRSPVRSRAPS